MIVGLTGSFGAGKGWVADYLVAHKGFAHFSARTFIIAEITKRGMPINRDSMIEVANGLRKDHGPTYIFEQLVAMATAHGGDCVVESIRAVAEAKYLKEQGGIVLGIDAPPLIRYERIKKRGNETDDVTFEQWRDQEIRESNPDDPTKQDIFGALKISDTIINNDGDEAALRASIDAFLDEYRTATE
jgi:dephospho-CoA kinase